MLIGVPTEIKRDEYRVGLLPVGVEELTRAGHDVLAARRDEQAGGLPGRGARERRGEILMNAGGPVHRHLDDFVGNTPLVALQRLGSGRNTLLAKLEGWHRDVWSASATGAAEIAASAHKALILNTFYYRGSAV